MKVQFSFITILLSVLFLSSCSNKLSCPTFKEKKSFAIDLRMPKLFKNGQHSPLANRMDRKLSTISMLTAMDNQNVEQLPQSTPFVTASVQSESLLLPQVSLVQQEIIHNQFAAYAPKAKKGVIQNVKEKIAIKAIEKYLHNQERLAKASPIEAPVHGGDDKSQVIALILVLLVGGLGIHRFYLGYTGIGIIQLLTLGGCGIWTLIDLIRIILGDLKPKNGDYNPKL